jgi:hypothetical protein
MSRVLPQPVLPMRDASCLRSRSSSRSRHSPPGRPSEKHPEAPRLQGLNIPMDIAVIALERLGQGANAGDIVAADIMQQLHPLARKNPGQRIPAFKCKMAFLESLSPLAAMPCVNKALRGFSLDVSADSDFDFAHFTPRAPLNRDGRIWLSWVIRQYSRSGTVRYA